MAESKQSSAEMAYAREVGMFRKYKALVEDDSLTEEELRKHLRKLTKQYGRLLDDVKLLTSVGDRLQRKLKSANMMLQTQSDEIRQINDDLQVTNEELKLTIDELTKARAGRKAQTFIFIVVVLLFVISENIEQFLDSLLGESLEGQIISWSLKIGLVVLLKPLEGLIERQLVKSSMDRKSREVLEQYSKGQGESSLAVEHESGKDD